VHGNLQANEPADGGHRQTVPTVPNSRSPMSYINNSEFPRGMVSVGIGEFPLATSPTPSILQNGFGYYAALSDVQDMSDAR